MKKEEAQRHTLKITAFFFAISLWYYVLNSEAVEIEKKLPINFKVPDGMVVVSPLQREVTIKLKGSKAFIKNIFSNKEKISIDLAAYYHPASHQVEKTFNVKIYSTDINVPFGVTILDISPKELTVQLDHKAIKEVPVKFQYIGELPSRKMFKDVRIIPSKLMISGPREILKTVNYFETIPLNLGLLNRDEGTVDVKLGEIDSRLKIEDSTQLKLKYKTQQIIQNNIKN